MQKLILVLYLPLCYFLLEGKLSHSSSLNGILALIATLLLIFLLYITKQKQPSNPTLTPSRKPYSLDYLILTLIACIALGLLYTTFTQGPKTLQSLYYTFSFDSQPDQQPTPERTSEHSNHRITGSEPWSETGNTISAGAIQKSKITPEVIIQLDSATDAQQLSTSPIYVSNYSNHQFDGHRWKSSNSGQTIIESNKNNLIPLSYTHSNLFSKYSYKIQRTYHPNLANTMACLQGAQQVSGIHRVTQVSDGVYLLPPPEKGQFSYKYQALSAPVYFQQIIQRGYPVEIEQTKPIYLKQTAHTGLADTLKQYCETFRQYPTTREKLIAIQKHLQSTNPYTLNTSTLSEHNPIQDFLQNNRPGYCTHFATAAALILRELNIPSRMTYGWAGGTYYPKNQAFVFHAHEAHAWCEVYLKHYGWVIYDTTPPDATPSLNQATNNESPPPELTPQNLTHQDNSEQEQTTSYSSAPIAWVSLLSLFGISVIILIILSMARNKKNQTLLRSTPPTSRSHQNYLHHFYQTCGQIGHPTHTGRTLCQHIEQLKQANIEEPFFETLLNYHYQITYQCLPQQLDLERELSESIRAWSQQHNT